MSDDFPDGATMIFGGSGGIGAEIAVAFARAGTGVAICYNARQDRAEHTAAIARSHGVDVTLHQTDVRQSDSVSAALEAAIAEHRRIHTLVWAAGPIVSQVRIADWPEEMVRQSVEIESLGFFHAAKAAIPHFREAGGGSFVHLGSAGHEWWPNRDGLSVAPKAFNEALVKGIAKEEGRHGIRANSVLVGVVDAGQFKIGQAEGYFDDRWVEASKKLIALRRLGDAEDVAQAAIFFASDRANYITGQTLSVSGGFAL